MVAAPLHGFGQHNCLKPLTAWVSNLCNATNGIGYCASNGCFEKGGCSLDSSLFPCWDGLQCVPYVNEDEEDEFRCSSITVTIQNGGATEYTAVFTFGGKYTNAGTPLWSTGSGPFTYLFSHSLIDSSDTAWFITDTVLSSTQLSIGESIDTSSMRYVSLSTIPSVTNVNRWAIATATESSGNYRDILINVPSTTRIDADYRDATIICADVSFGRCAACAFPQYCPNGTVNPTRDPTANLCSSGYYCPNTYTSKVCPLGSYCLGGSNPVTVCPTGSFCAEGTASFAACQCEKGYYCPNSSSRIICPKGFFCPAAVAKPVACTALSTCDEGSSVENKLPYFGWGYGVFLFFLTLVYLFSLCTQRRYLKKRVVASELNDEVYNAMIAIDATLKRKSKPRFRGFHARSNTVKVSFDCLHMSLKSNNQTILDSVTGEFSHSQMHAIMGPSGCGKSTFLNALSGRSHYGVTSGSLKLNDVTVHDLKSFSSEMGFAPQDDTVHEMLTVRENLDLSARLRKSPNISDIEIEAFVTDTIQILQMSHIEDSIVGSVEKRGISGGQRKRVNIGMELVTNPSLLFLDEPTSGLDASTTLSLLHALRSVSRLGITIIMVLHQPRYDAFLAFDNLLLLGFGGRTIYMGPSTLCHTYFTSLGYSMAFGQNPSDFFLDVISGEVSKPATDEQTNIQIHGHTLRNQTSHSAGKLSPDEVSKDLRAQWEKIGIQQVQEALMKTDSIPSAEKTSSTIRRVLETSKTSTFGLSHTAQILAACGVQNPSPFCCEQVLALLDTNKDGKISIDDFYFHSICGDFIARKRQNLFRQFMVYGYRDYLIAKKKWKQFAAQGMLLAMPPILQYIMFGQDWFSWDLTPLILSALLLGIFVGLLSPMLLIPERLLLSREATSGLSVPAYFLSKVILDILICWFYSILFALSFFCLCSIIPSFWTVYKNTFCVVFYCHGLGLLFTSIFENPNPPCGVTMAATAIILNGYMIPPSVLGSAASLGKVTFLRWWVASMFINEYNTNANVQYSWYWRKTYTSVMTKAGYSSTDSTDAIYALITLGVLFRFFAGLILTYKMAVINGFTLVPLRTRKYVEQVINRFLTKMGDAIKMKHPK